MRVLLVGVPCVGKSTIGRLLAQKWGYTFIDFDFLIEEKMGDSIERMKNTCFNEYEFRQRVKHILAETLHENKDNLVIAMPPSGLFREYKSIIDNLHTDVITIALKDKAKNILERLCFYDEDSKLIEDYAVNESNRDYYYNEIKADIEYYYATHRKANIQFRINGMSAEESAESLAVRIKEYVATDR